MWWKKTITKEEMGQQLWLLCCKCDGDFCSKLKPKFKAKGFLRNAEEDALFAFESTILHVWLFSLALNEDQDRPILDVLHYSFSRACEEMGRTDKERSQTQAYGEETAKKRFQLYYKAFSKDKELRSKGLSTTVLADTAIKCLVPVENSGSFLIAWEVDCLIHATIKAVRNLRKEFRVR